MSLSFNGVRSGLQRLLTLEQKIQSRETLESGAKSWETLESSPHLHHYTHQNAGEKSRIHLRLDPDGHGTLIVNANRIMHLNPTAALMAYLILEGKTEAETVHALTRRYRVSPKQALSDLQTFDLRLSDLIRPDGACPIHGDYDSSSTAVISVVAPFSARPSAPYRMDLALTYRCNNDCAHCYNIRPNPPIPPSLEGRGGAGGIGPGELSTDDWKRILDKAWELGIPHIIFTGGEPTLRNDLPELVAHAERNGQITGLNTNARRLSDARYVETLVAAGLDHIQITLESHDPEIHDRMVRAKGAWPQTVAGLKNALASPLYVMTNTTMLQVNAPGMSETLDFLAELGVPTVGLNALIYSGRGATVGTGLPERDLTPLLEIARAKAEAHGQRLIWYTPTQYCNFDPMQMDLGVKGCTAALYNMCVEPDGGVLPCQSYYQPLGNLLKDPWDSIWNHELAVKLRERQGLPEKCNGCALLSECGGGCPLQFQDVVASAKGAKQSRGTSSPEIASSR
jgi:radical SAM protein with 4Fe4S-binding SPASM domain